MISKKCLQKIFQIRNGFKRPKGNVDSLQDGITNYFYFILIIYYNEHVFYIEKKILFWMDQKYEV